MKEFNEIMIFFQNQSHFVELTNVKLKYINKIFTSAEQIMGIAVLEKELDLKEMYDDIADEFAIAVQSQLKDKLTDLKWDMYLIYFVSDDITDENLKRKIENNRVYFKKFVFSKNYTDYKQKLPMNLTIKTEPQGDNFSEKAFVSMLRQSLPKEVSSLLYVDSINEINLEALINKKIILPIEEMM